MSAVQGRDQVLRAAAFVDAHLAEALTVSAIADAAGCSLYHFCRVFNAWTGHSPYDYLIRRRLTEAARAIVGTDRKLIDIGLDFQFNNPETFSRAFRRMFGMPPLQFRNRKLLDPRNLREPLTSEALDFPKTDARPLVIPERRICGLAAWIPRTAAAIQELWSQSAGEAARISGAAAVAAGQAYGLMVYPRDWPARGVFYLAGWEESSLPGEGPAWVRKAIPESSGWCAPLTQGWTQMTGAWSCLYQTAMPLAGCRPGDYEWHVVTEHGRVLLQVPAAR